MTPEETAYVLGYITGALVMTFIMGVALSLVGAIILRMAAKWVADLEVTYLKAFVTLVISQFLSIIVGVVLGIMIGLSGADEEMANTLLLALYPIGFLVQTGVIAWRFQVTLGKALLMNFVLLAAAIALGVLAGILVFGFLMMSG